MPDRNGWRIDGAGWADRAIVVPSPHRDERPGGMPIDLLVIHNITLPPGQFGGPEVADLFLGRLDCDAHPYFERLRGLRVSAHFLVRRDGTPIQFVSCLDRAWHAGESEWAGRRRCNDFSIGIELEGTDDTAFEDVQYRTLAVLAAAIHHRFPIADVVGHSDIAPGRKTDPGPCFDWPRFRRMLVDVR